MTMRRKHLYLDRRAQKLNGPPEGESWGWMTREMCESAAFRAMSRPAYQVVMRVLIEHMSHGGLENGRLPVTQLQFAAYGVRRQSVSAAIAEAELLGFIMRTDPGRRSWGEFKGRAARFRLTWLQVIEPNDRQPATNDWKRFAELKAAKNAVREMQAKRKAERKIEPAKAKNARRFRSTAISAAQGK